MKKNNLLQFVVLLCICQLATIFSVRSQGVDKPLSFGAKVGLSNSVFTNYQQRADSYNKWGFAGGAFAEYKLIDLVGVEINLNYVQEGADKASPSIIYPQEFLNSYSSMYGYGGMYAYIQSSDITLHTLEVPILFNIRPPVKGDVIPRLILGYSFDFILNATTKDEIMFYNYDTNTGYTYYPITKRNKSNVTSSFKTLNMGPVLGLGIDFKSDNLTYLIDARYKIGLNDINNLGELNINGNRNFSNNTFTVTLGIAF